MVPVSYTHLFLNKGITIVLKDERENQEKEEDFCYEGGLLEYVEMLNENKDALHEAIYVHGEMEGKEVEISMQYNTCLLYTSTCHIYQMEHL